MPVVIIHDEGRGGGALLISSSSFSCSPPEMMFKCSVSSFAAVATEPLLSPAASDFITQSFKDRWRTLMSVDDIVAEVFAIVEEADEMDNTVRRVAHTVCLL